MKKSEQLSINRECEQAFAMAWDNEYVDADLEWTRLRNCTAWVAETENYIWLRSYNTIVAFIVKSTDTLYDILRYVYGYTSTSAQHIAKFRHDYGEGKWGCEHEMRYYPV